MDKMTTWGDFLEQNWLDREGVKGRGWEKKIKSTISPTWMFHGLLGSHRWTVNHVFLPWPESSKYTDTPSFFFPEYRWNVVVTYYEKKIAVEYPYCLSPFDQLASEQEKGIRLVSFNHACTFLLMHRWTQNLMTFKFKIPCILISGTSDRCHVIMVATLTRCFKLVKRDTNQIKLLLNYIYWKKNWHCP
jgi:hypothetical protein